MISLTHITEAELRQFYLLEGKISGRDKEINMFNGVQQEYTIRFRDDSHITKLFTAEAEKPEVQNMNRLFCGSV